VTVAFALALAVAVALVLTRIGNVRLALPVRLAPLGLPVTGSARLALPALPLTGNTRLALPVFAAPTAMVLGALVRTNAWGVVV
jgi:hypothetical protein